MAPMMSLGLTLGAAGCAVESASGSCSWFFAPFGVVDAGEPGCIAEPAGTICDPSSGSCPNVCQPNEYLLTCLVRDMSSNAIPEEALRDPVITGNRGIQCTAADARDGAVGATRYCCQCAR
jgi:hypothetical protein